MAKKTNANPRGAGRKPKPDSEKMISFTVTARRPVVEAITGLARRRGLTRGQYIQRLLNEEARKFDNGGKRGRLLGELLAVALKIAEASRGDAARIRALRGAAIDRPAATFPTILDFCALELPSVTRANGREILKTRLADLTMALGFSFPEVLTSAEREAFDAAFNKTMEQIKNERNF